VEGHDVQIERRIGWQAGYELMTITGLILIPLAMICAGMKWRVFLPFLFVCSVLTTAAVINKGTVGLQPVYFADLLLIVRTLTDVTLNRTPLNIFVFKKMTALSLFYTASVFALLISLIAFEGRIHVVGGTDAFQADLAQPYTFRRENITQLAYLSINVAVVYCLAHQIARIGWKEACEILESAIISAIVFSEFFVGWQIASFYMGIPFPDSFIYSNVGYSRAAGQILRGVLRVSGPFEEPSTLAYFFTGFALFSWILYRNRRITAHLLLAISCVVVLLVSTSTTAYFGLVVISSLILRDIVTGRALTVTGNAKISRRTFVSFLIVLGAALVVGSYGAFHWDSVEAIYNETVAEKLQSSSFSERHWVDMMAIDIFAQTGGLGVGLGSHKPNSLIMTIVSNAGIFGSVAIVAFFYYLLMPGRSLTGIPQRAEIKHISPFQAMLLGLLLVHIFSNPNLSMGILWLSSGAVLGLVAALRLERTTRLATSVGATGVNIGRYRG
jgi:hypothetical protein